MSTIYINGKHLPPEKALIPINDRGLLFGESIYEVLLVHNKKLVDIKSHFERLKKSLYFIKIENPFHSLESFHKTLEEVISANNVIFGSCYIQITSGTERLRKHCQDIEIEPNVIITCSHGEKPSMEDFDPKKVITDLDDRWRWRNVKTTNLLPNTLALKKAKQMEADDCIFFNEHGIVTEATSSSVLIIMGDNIFYRQNDNDVLPGTTLQRIIEEGKSLNISEKKISCFDLDLADEIILLSSVKTLVPISYINNKKIGNHEYKITKQLKSLYIDFLERNFS